MRSLQLTSAHSMPSAPAPHSSTGSPPAGDKSSRRSAAASIVGKKARSHSTIRIAVAEVDHGSDTATATTSPSATWPSRRARTLELMSGESRLRPDMAIMRLVALTEVGGCAQCRQAELRARAVAVQYLIEPRIVGGQLRPVRVRVPQMDDAGGEAPVLAPQAAMQQTDQQIGILAAPAAEAGVEAVDPLEIGTPDGEIARARASPSPRLELAQRPERQSQHAGQPIDAATPTLADPPGQVPCLRPQVLAQHRCGEARREQYPVAGHEPSALGQPAMRGEEIGGD